MAAVTTSSWFGSTTSSIVSKLPRVPTDKNQESYLSMREETQKIIDTITDTVFSLDGIINGGYIRDRKNGLLPGETLFPEKIIKDNTLPGDIDIVLNDSATEKRFIKTISAIFDNRMYKIANVNFIGDNNNTAYNTKCVTYKISPIQEGAFFTFMIDIVICFTDTFFNGRNLDMTSNILFQTNDCERVRVPREPSPAKDCLDTISNRYEFITRQIQRGETTILPSGHGQYRSRNEILKMLERIKKMIERGWKIRQVLKKCSTFVVTTYSDRLDTFPSLSKNDPAFNRIRDTSECPIMKEDFENNSLIVVTSCYHIFSFVGFQKTVQSSGINSVRCPICKDKIK
tara:strand:- start:253 stop:1281 length:1029 start_codon:yes stop_codon:yes gene_type:complete